MNKVSGRPWRRWLGLAALAVTSGAAGWALGQRGHDEPAPTPADIADARAAAPPRVPEARRRGAAIQSHTDGTGRRGPTPAEPFGVANDGAAVASESFCELADEDSGVVDVGLLERTLAESTESERYAALTRALHAGIDLPPELLRQTYTSDPSESVRLLAFTTHVDSVSDNRAEARFALESGIYNDSSAVQAEAQRRLAELEQYERALAETAAQGLP